MHVAQDATSSQLEVKSIMELDISQVATAARTSPSTLRYYEERGLIKPIGRKGLKRLYDDDVLEKLALIALGRAAGFSLDEIAAMFGGDGQPDIDRSALIAKAEQLDKAIDRLTAMRDGLRHASACQAPSHMECPKFRRIVRAAARGALKGKGETLKLIL